MNKIVHNLIVPLFYLIIKITKNRYFILLGLLFYKTIGFAHDCSSPGDCEQTAGYNAAVAMVGGVIALGVGLMTSGMSVEPTVDEDVSRDENMDTVTEEEPEITEESSNEEDTATTSSDSETDDEDFEIVEGDEEEDLDELFEDSEEDLDDIIDDFEDFEDDIDDDLDKLFDDTDSGNKEIDGKLTSDTTDTAIDETQKVLDTSNNLKTVIESAGATGVKLWQGILKGKEYTKAAERYREIINNLKNKNLNGLAIKYAQKLDKLLKGKANRLIVNQTKGAKSLFRNLKKIKALGHAADLFTFINNINKKTKGGSAQADEITGAVAEEILRYGLKQFLTKNPAIAVGDALLSLAGGPNLDYVIDKSIDTYKEGVTKATEWAYSKPKTDDDKFYDSLRRRKEKINKMKISKAEKRRRIKRVYKILKDNPALWK